MNKYIVDILPSIKVLMLTKCSKCEYGVPMTSNERDISLTFSFSLTSDRWRWWIEFCVSIPVFRISMNLMIEKCLIADHDKSICHILVYTILPSV